MQTLNCCNGCSSKNKNDLMRLLPSLYLHQRLYLALSAIVFVLLLGFPYPVFFTVGQFLLLSLFLLLCVDILLLFRDAKGLQGGRTCAERFSNGDENTVKIQLQNRYPFPVKVGVIDELPEQFQVRDFLMTTALQPAEAKELAYTLRPVKRGEYQFGRLLAFVSSPIRLVERRFAIAQPQLVSVYPSFLQMRRYEIMAISNRLAEMGVKKIRRVGHSREFDQVREYVMGDDTRLINWKATARRSSLMLNQYQDERSQQVYCLIDKGRAMKMPFGGMSLLDYAINASLVLSNIALLKQDKAGILTFGRRVATFLGAKGQKQQIVQILEALYREKTGYKETDFEQLYTVVNRRITHRSLLLLFTNFETLPAMQRQLPYLRLMAKMHLLVVVFFENTALRELLDKPALTTEEVYVKTVGEKFAYEKRLIVQELKRHGIQTILTPPEGLTVSTLNKYLEIKARGLI